MSVARRAVRRAARRVLPVLAVLGAMSSCGIPATGVVEAGGPASGIAPVTAVYFVRDGELAAVLRPVEVPGDASAALVLLLEGPPPGDRITTEVKPLLARPASPSAEPSASLDPGTDPGDSATPPSDRSVFPWASDAPVVSEDRGELTVRLPDRMRELTDLGIGQVVCTVAAARRVAAPELSVVTVELLAGGERFARRSDGRCPRV
ncbi:hypothetical protein ABZX85_30445 [Streptomyces sp. NPDC004539]|uniref:hypothetical protein n=1 Tax=Streptomyces sp. NPDC004539 TaxID=3154280 RepID=UPI0033A4AD31